MKLISEYGVMLEPEAGVKPAVPPANAAAEPRMDAPAEPPAVEAPTQMRARLLGISGTHRGTMLPLDRSPLRIGSAADDNDVVIHHPSILRRHLRLHLVDGAWKVIDGEARGGMRVNGAPFTGVPLRHGDVIELGHVRFAFAGAGRELQLPPEFAPISSPPSRGRPASRTPVKAILGLLAILLAGALLLRHPGDDASAGAVKEETRGEILREVQSAIVAKPPEGASPTAPAPAARPVRAARAAAFSSDAPARKLVDEGNRKLIAQDLPGAIALYEQALVLRPRRHVLAAAYRGMGVAFTRQGNIEEGAHYYKLYLPLCSDPAEQAQVQKLLDDYAARRR